MYDHPAFDNARKLYRKWKIPTEADYPRKLPLLDRFRQDRQNRGRSKCRPFEGFHLLSIQHHLGPLLRRMEVLFDAGVKPENCWFVDIPYSTNAYVWHELRKMGCPLAQAASPMNHPLHAYNDNQLLRVSSIIEAIAKAGPEKLLVIDDGAYFLRALNQLQDGDRDITHQFGTDKDQTKVAIVEQTTRGHRFASARTAQTLLDEIQAPLVSAARTFTKRRLEGFFIGEAVAKSLRTMLETKLRPNNVIILGYGVVGQATVAALRRLELNTTVVEPDRQKHPMIEAAGATPIPRLPSTRRASHFYDLVIGCTGYGSFALSNRNLLADGAHLVSASSAAGEFNRPRLIERANDAAFRSLQLTNPSETDAMRDTEDVTYAIHEPLTFSASGQSDTFNFTFVNAGFPVNFTGEVECLPVPLIQPTHGLLYAAAVEATKRLGNGEAGLYELNEDDDLWLFLEGAKELDDESIWECR
jgi:hypothetical protein